MYKEIGGFFSLDIGYLSCMNNEPFFEVDEQNKKRVNAARYAICEVVKFSGFTKIHVPVYMCESIRDAIKKFGIEYDVYNIDTNMFPESNVSIPDSECILICNYWGIYNEDFYKKIKNRFKNIIFDNTQAFYISPTVEENIYYVYSPRKFVGVADGAYIIGKDVGNIDSVSDSTDSYNHYEYIMKALEDGTNAAYELSKEREQLFEIELTKSMSKLTKKILDSIDYASIKEKRVINFNMLHKILGMSNQLKVSYYNETYPMVYPYLTRDKKLRNRLIENKIYIPQWWKYILDETCANTWEKELSEFLLPIPIDHRYTIDDMSFIASIIMEK